MAICGKPCFKVVQEADALKCDCCGDYYHQECVNIQKQLCQGIIRWKTPNVIFRCDKCTGKDDDKSIKSMFKSMMNQMTRNENLINERFDKLITKIDSIAKTSNENGKTVIEEIAKVVDEAKSESNMKWSEVVSKKRRKKNDSVVVITPKDKDQDRQTTQKSLRKTINAEDYTVKGWSNASNNGVVIRCENDNDRDKLLQEAAEKLGQNYEVKKPMRRLPRFKILKVLQPSDNDEQFIRDLKQRNPNISGEKYKFEVIKREQVKEKGENVDECFNIVMQSDGETFNEVTKTGRLKTKWKLCKVVDNVYIRRCYKCYGFDHDFKSCDQPEISCSICSLAHLSKDCKSKVKCCNVCVKANKRIKSLNLPTGHDIWSQQCPSYQRKLAISKRAINYVE